MLFLFLYFILIILPNFFVNFSKKNLKKILIPGLELSDLKAVNKLLTPSNFLIPMFFISTLAQISDNLKSILSFNEIQKLISVKVYSKVIFSGLTVVSMTVLQSISKTLGYELESLSVLSIKERLFFLDNLRNKLVNGNYKPKLYSSETFLRDPILLSNHRMALSIQSRSVMISVPIFSPQSIIVGIPIRDISLSFILSSSRSIWISIGLEDEEFDYLLRKEVFLLLNKMNLNLIFSKLITNEDYFKILVFLELFVIIQFNSKLSFFEDQILLKGEANLVLLEKELGFIERPIPNFPLGSFVLESNEVDSILSIAIEQRKLSAFKIARMLKRLGKSNYL